MTAAPQNDSEHTISELALMSSMWNYASNILYPSIVLKAFGLYTSEHFGSRPPLPTAPGLGLHFSRCCPFPVLLEDYPVDPNFVEELDRVSQDSEHFRGTLAKLLFKEAIEIIQQYLTPSSRVLSIGCRAATEAMELAMAVPEGEIVTADLAVATVRSKYVQARCAGIGNMAFFQAHLPTLPHHFTSMFDAIYCSPAFHHYAGLIATLRELYPVLRPGGYLFLGNQSSEWFKPLAGRIADQADTDWRVGIDNHREFQALFRGVGFSSFYWEELLPGMGFVVTRK
jgi:SAM-dependent methyltransferase